MKRSEYEVLLSSALSPLLCLPSRPAPAVLIVDDQVLITQQGAMHAMMTPET